MDEPLSVSLKKVYRWENRRHVFWAIIKDVRDYCYAYKIISENVDMAGKNLRELADAIVNHPIRRPE